MSDEGKESGLRDIEWFDRVGLEKDDVTLLQFADRFSRILYLTSLKFEDDEVPDVFETLTAITFSIAETVESFGPHESKGESEREGKDV